MAQSDLKTGSVRIALLRMGAPMLLGLGALVSVGVVDAYYLGQLGTQPLAAIGYCFPLMMFAAGFTNGIASAIQSVVSRATGAEKPETARQATVHAILLALVTSVCAAVIGVTFLDEIFGLLGATEDVIPLIRDYITVWFGALFFFVAPMVAGSALMARGDATSPTLFMIAGAIVNAILDPLLIYGVGPFPELGIAGAAWASLAARMCVTFGTLFILFRDDVLRPKWADLLGGYLESWRKLLSIALPVTLAAFVFPAGLSVVTRVVSGFGDAAVAAYGGGSRIDGVFQLVAAALGMGLAPIVGQNWGAKLKDRVRDAVRFSQIVAIGWGFLGWGVLWFWSADVADWFVDGSATAPLALYLAIIPARYAAGGVEGVCHQAFNAIDRATDATVITVIHLSMVVALLPMLAGYERLEIVFIGIVAIDFVAAFLMAARLHFLIR